MATIIRATDANRDIQRTAFNFEDMAVQAERYLDGVRGEAGRIVAAAQKEAELIRRRAAEEGRAAGMQKVQDLVQQQLKQQLATLIPALDRVVQDIRHAKQAWLSHWEKSAVKLAVAIAGRIVRRQIDRDPQVPLPLIREGLELAAGSSQIRVHLHPADLDALRPNVQTLVEKLAPLAAVELLPDAAIAKGGCRIDTRLGTIDQQIDSQLRRIEEELTEQ